MDLWGIILTALLRWEAWFSLQVAPFPWVGKETEQHTRIYRSLACSLLTTAGMRPVTSSSSSLDFPTLRDTLSLRAKVTHSTPTLPPSQPQEKKSRQCRRNQPLNKQLSGWENMRCPCDNPGLLSTDGKSLCKQEKGRDAMHDGANLMSHLYSGQGHASGRSNG